MVLKEAKIKNVTNWELWARKMGGVPQLAAGNAFLPSQKLPLQVKEEEEDEKPVWLFEEKLDVLSLSFKLSDSASGVALGSWEPIPDDYDE